MTPTLERLLAVLGNARLRASTEAALQVSIEGTLEAAGFEFKREASLGPKDRPDFLVGSIAIEAKCRYPKKAIYRQVARYAAHDTVSAVVLITGTPLGMPAAIDGKPIYVLSLGAGSLGC